MISPLGQSYRQNTYSSIIKTMFGANLAAHWQLDELAGAVKANDISGYARNGAYSSGVVLSNIISAYGKLCPLLGSDYIDIYSAQLAAAFNSQEGGIIAMAKVLDAATWADATSRHIVNLRVDTNNRIYIWKSTTNNQLLFLYTAGGTQKSGTYNGLAGTTPWFQVAISWSKSNDRVLFFVNGEQVGTTQTGLGVWAGALASTLCGIGAVGSLGSNPWSGWISDVILVNREITAAEVLALNDIRVDSISLSDNFDDSVLAEQWVAYLNTEGVSTGSITEVGGKLRVGQINATGGDHTYVSTKTKYKVQGDFDITVDFDLITYPNTNAWYVYLQCGSNLDVDGKPFDEIRAFIQYKNDVRRYGGEIRKDALPDLLDDTGAYAATSDTSGKLRIRRIGTIGYTYYWDGAAWILLYSAETNSTDMAVKLWISSFIGLPDIEVNYDNLIVTADKILVGAV